MRKLYPILLFLIYAISSCKENECKIKDYLSSDWLIIDSTTRYFICNASENALTASDSIDVEYLGVYKKSDNLVIQGPTDEMAFSILTSTNFGRFSVSDTTLPKSIRFAIQKMKKGSICTIRYDFSDIKAPTQDRKITVYFKDYVDSFIAYNWLKKITTEPFIDSFKYISKKSALEIFAGEEDTSWAQVLDKNLLPSLADIFINENSFDTAFVSKMKKVYLEESIVSDVSYSNLLTSETWQRAIELLKDKFFIRVSSIK